MISSRWAGRTQPNAASRKRGIALVLLIVTLGTGALILMSALRVTMHQGFSLNREQRFVQARQYAQAALERVRLRLKSQPQFTGERWNIPSFQLEGQSPATAVIGVHSVPNQVDQRSIQIEIEFPAAFGGPWNYHSTHLLLLKTSPGTNP